MTASQSTTTPVVRTDIQGLRALAVSLVLVYHLSPTTLTGGFVGVDVFFVISGFLITLHLLGHVPTTARDLVAFWSRRVRRLLPASLLVLASTLVASRLLAPASHWADTADQTRAATLYVVNWVLSNNAVDYLAAENAPSPVQHFWSLSVEEQFYFVWPILILLLALLARKMRQENTLHLILGGLVMVVAGSLAYSIHITATNPPAAYFVTPARVWELGVGGILATVTLIAGGHSEGHRHRAVREGPPAFVAVPLAWAGFGAIAYSAVMYTSATPFPGWQAAIPVLGTAAVIGARSMSGSGSPGNLLSLPAVQWMGDVSYSVYLWHWPLVVIVPQVTGHDLTWTERGSIVLATLGLASLTKTFVEDRFRSARWGIPLPKPFAIAGLAMVVVITGAAAQLREVDQRVHDSQLAAARKLAGNDPCFGAPSLLPGSDCPTVTAAELIPSPVAAHTDKSAAYNIQANGLDCFATGTRFAVRQCTFGPRRATTNVVLVGNSHAGQWVPAVTRLARKNNFKVTAFLASRCASSEVPQQLDTDAQSAGCADWVRKVVSRISKLKPDLVLMTNRISVPAVGEDLTNSFKPYRDGYIKVLEAWKKAGIPVLVLHDTPAPGEDIPDCVAGAGDDFARCDGPRSVWSKPEPAKDAVEAVNDPRIRFVDLTDHICQGNTCHAVTGGVVTYFDGSHLTATYNATLAPFLGEMLLPLLPKPAAP